jgi:hypothetical protein
MIRALLASRKTQTRRIVDPGSPAGTYIQVGGRGPTFDPRIAHHADLMRERCPYGVAGDRLWVKETFAPSVSHPDALTMPEYDGGQNPAHLYYRADVRNGVIDGCDDDRVKWKPSIYMPRWASRITLKVDSVRVEKLSSISEDDAKAEGVVAGFDSPHDA